jgi:FixJ family two-component response regulator
LKVIYTSGYNTNYLNTEFFRKGAAVFVQKPYTRSSLAKAVRECLDEPRASQ